MSEIQDPPNLKVIQAKVDHDLRSHLNVVLGFSELIKEEYTAGDTQQVLDYLGCINSAGRELLRLNYQVDDLMHLRVGTWNRRIQPSTLQSLLNDVELRLAERHPLHVLRIIDGEIVNVDTRALARVLDAISSTFCKFTSKGAVITIEPEGNALCIGCAPTAAEEDEVARLEHHLDTMMQQVQEMSDIKEFDAYYLTTLCEYAAFNISRVPGHLVCRLEFDATT